jgi:5-aminolevulinate synthase
MKAQLLVELENIHTEIITKAKIAKVNYPQLFTDAVNILKCEGRYREFHHIERVVGSFPIAKSHTTGKDITIWCSNDYLGMGHHDVVLGAMHEAIESRGWRHT